MATPGKLGVRLLALLAMSCAQEVQLMLGMDDVQPMGIEDLSAVLPMAGPFAPSREGVHQDPFIAEFMKQSPNPAFMEKLSSMLQSRHPTPGHPCDKEVERHCHGAMKDRRLYCLGRHAAMLSSSCKEEIRHTVPFVCHPQIERFCDGLEVPILHCLESHGSQIGVECRDAIIAARQALSSIAASHRKALEVTPGSVEHDRRSHAREQLLTGTCPSGWEGPKAGGCCTRRWSPRCKVQCSQRECNEDGWEFRWADFRTHPYICCPKARPREQYIGGQPLCPSGWKSEPHGSGFGYCCRKAWSWDCGEHCAMAQCRHNVGLAWHEVNETEEPYRCCPSLDEIGGRDHHSGQFVKGKDSALLPGLPADFVLATPNWAYAAVVASALVLAVFFLPPPDRADGKGQVTTRRSKCRYLLHRS